MTTILRSLAFVLLLAVGCGNEPRVFTDDLEPVPDVSGLRVAEAREELQDLGFLVRVFPEGQEVETSCSNGTVASQDPAGEEEVLKASTITLEARGCDGG